MTADARGNAAPKACATGADAGCTSSWKRKSAGEGRPRYISTLLALGVNQFHPVNGVPAGRSFQLAVDVVDVLHAFGFQPLAERRSALLGVHRDTFFPGRAAAEHAVKLHA